MTSTLEHIEQALDHLREARDSAGMGTAMMLGEIIPELEGVYQRLDNINNGDGNTDRRDE